MNGKIRQFSAVSGNRYVRLTLAMLLILAGYLGLTVYFVDSYTEQIDDTRKETLERIVQMGLNEIQYLREPPEGSVYSPTAARREAATRIRSLTKRYDLGENYLFMTTYDGVLLVQPNRPEIEYTNQWDLTDAHGSYFVQDLIAAAQRDDRQGYVEYHYPPPGSDDPQRKITYVVGIPEWECLIGSGMYMDDIDAEKQAYLRNSLLLTGGLFLLILGVVTLAIRPIIRSYGTLLGLFERISRTPESIPPVPIRRFRPGSEGWQLLNGLQTMLTQLEQSRHAAETAAAEERNRLARELHDAVTQTLFSASLIADVLPRLWERDRAAGEQHLNELKELTRGALAEMRTLLVELRPARLLETDLHDLLKQLATAVTGRARIPVGVQIERECDVPPDVKIALYRIAQEALNNIVKHAEASHANLTLRCTGTDIALHIQDDGCGFDPADIPPEHLGVGIMRERAEAIGAAFTVTSNPGQGTHITVNWNREQTP